MKDIDKEIYGEEKRGGNELDDRVTREQMLAFCEAVDKEKIESNQLKSVSKENMFSVLDIVGKEVMYCRVLLYLLKNNWNSFEEQVLGKCCDGEKLASAETEYPCNPPCQYYDKEGRIDILLRTQNHVVAIEVKVDAGDQEHQLIRYQKELGNSFENKTIHIFYLTPYGSEPSSDSLNCDWKQCKESTKCSVKEYKKISFNRDICEWLRKLVSEYEEHSIAKDFLEVLEMNQNNYEGCVEFLEKNSNYAKVVFTLNEAIPSFFEKIRDAFFDSVAEKLKNSYGFEDDVDFPTEFKREIWPVNLKKDGNPLHFCYETNFFFRIDDGEQWQYLKADVFDLEFLGSEYECLSKKSGEAFNVKSLSHSSFGLIDWYFMEQGKKEEIIKKCAAAAVAFWRDNV